MSFLNNPFLSDSTLGTANETALAGLQTAGVTENFARETLGLELAGLTESQELNSAFNAFGNALDLEYLTKRFETGNFLRGVENSVFNGMTQEKLENLEFEMNFNQTQNRFNLAKSVVNSAKYGG